jgi:hypothetical protein
MGLMMTGQPLLTLRGRTAHNCHHAALVQVPEVHNRPLPPTLLCITVIPRLLKLRLIPVCTCGACNMRLGLQAAVYLASPSSTHLQHDAECNNHSEDRTAGAAINSCGAFLRPPARSASRAPPAGLRI